MCETPTARGRGGLVWQHDILSLGISKANRIMLECIDLNFVILDRGWFVGRVAKEQRPAKGLDPLYSSDFDVDADADANVKHT